jgi:hypothetical protein
MPKKAAPVRSGFEGEKKQEINYAYIRSRKEHLDVGNEDFL